MCLKNLNQISLFKIKYSKKKTLENKESIMQHFDF